MKPKIAVGNVKLKIVIIIFCNTFHLLAEFFEYLIELLAEMSFTLLFINFIRVVHGPMGILKCNRSINDLNAERGEKRNDF